MTIRISIPVSLIAIAMLPLNAVAADDIVMTITGQKQGTFRGIASRDGKSTDQIRIATLPQSGLFSTGKNGIHEPKAKLVAFTISKAEDWSSPMIKSVADTDELLPKVVIQVYREDGDNSRRLIESIILTNAHIARIKQERAMTARYGAAQNARVMEQVTLSYEKMDVRRQTPKPAQR